MKRYRITAEIEPAKKEDKKQTTTKTHTKTPTRLSQVAKEIELLKTRGFS